MYLTSILYSHLALLVSQTSGVDVALSLLTHLAPFSGWLGYVYATPSTMFGGGVLSTWSYLVISNDLWNYIELYKIGLSLENSQIAVFNKSYNTLNSVCVCRGQRWGGWRASYLQVSVSFCGEKKHFFPKKIMPSLCIYSVNLKFYRF